MNLFDFDRLALREYFKNRGEKPFRGDQLIQWVHQRGNLEITQMTNLSKSLREILPTLFTMELPKIITEQLSKDGTRKWLMQLEDGAHIETVLIPEGDRKTLCVSSQVGCSMGCVFCATGKQGFTRNLTASEIIGQLWVVTHQVLKKNHPSDKPITNVVFMGMGEPLLNIEAVLKACRLMRDEWAYGLSKYRVTISTVGVVPAIQLLSAATDVSLAVSLHAPTDELRNKLVPINRRYPLRELIHACRQYFSKDSKRKIAFEYVMLKDVNDQKEHAKQLIKLLQGVPAKINLIYFNAGASSHSIYEKSSEETVQLFQKILLQSDIRTLIRRSRGDDIKAACGQLVAMP